ncbi:MAG: DUF1015 domain-containing protein [Euryarchaeota archaeon]|nr:DUF1015 domain-containing protein [Euryarchaeota archaeon]
MVDFRPFRGILPYVGSDENINERVSPPYDVISKEEQAELQSKEYNISRITLGGLDGRYDEAARLLDGWISSEKLMQDDSECYYLYRQSFQGQKGLLSRNGIIGILKTEDYNKGIIMPHEETFSNVKEDRLNLLRATATHCESIFGLYDYSDIDLENLSERADKLFEIVDDFSTLHQIFRIHDVNDTSAIQEMFSSKKMLIADGHHRYETAHRYAQENRDERDKAYVLCTMVASNDDGMLVLPTHRLIGNLNYEPTDLLENMKKYFKVQKIKNIEEMEKNLDSSTLPIFGLFLNDGNIYTAEYLQVQDGVLWSVDAYVCQEVIFKNILSSMTDVNELSVEYDHEVTSIANRMSEGGADLAIVVRAPSLDLVWNVAEQGQKMPKKTTYFWPKIWSGFILYGMK